MSPCVTSLFRSGHYRLSADFIGGLGCIGKNITHGIVSLHLKVSHLVVKFIKNLDLRNQPVISTCRCSLNCLMYVYSGKSHEAEMTLKEWLTLTEQSDALISARQRSHSSSEVPFIIPQQQCVHKLFACRGQIKLI